MDQAEAEQCGSSPSCVTCTIDSDYRESAAQALGCDVKAPEVRPIHFETSGFSPVSFVQTDYTVYPDLALYNTEIQEKIQEVLDADVQTVGDYGVCLVETVCDAGVSSMACEYYTSEFRDSNANIPFPCERIDLACSTFFACSCPNGYDFNVDLLVGRAPPNFPDVPVLKGSRLTTQ